MADIVDLGNETAGVFLDAALSHRKPEGPEPKGFCHNCGATLIKFSDRWCNTECRDDWESRL